MGKREDKFIADKQAITELVTDMKPRTRIVLDHLKKRFKIGDFNLYQIMSDLRKDGLISDESEGGKNHSYYRTSKMPEGYEVKRLHEEVSRLNNIIEIYKQDVKRIDDEYQQLKVDYRTMVERVQEYKKSYNFEKDLAYQKLKSELVSAKAKVGVKGEDHSYVLNLIIGLASKAVESR